jgi:hydroxypyruvate reductase
MTSSENAIEIFSAAVGAVQPARLIPQHLFIENNLLHIFDQQFLVNTLPNIYVIGAGKASAAMAKTVEDILGNLIKAGIVVTKYDHALQLQTIACREAAHPVPDEHGILATANTIQLLKQVKENDIVLCLISGGASSLWIDVPDETTLADVQETFQLLLNSGATIDEMNTVRKHLSAIKGGQLLRHAPKARWFSFIISDVPGDALQVIASGPTVADDTSFDDAKKILGKYDLLALLPSSILQHIKDGAAGIKKETVKTGDPVWNRVFNRIIGNNKLALEAAATRAKQLGYHIPSINKHLEGDAASAGTGLIRTCLQYNGPKPACFLLGGETTVAVTGKGKGGRNQQLVLSALSELALHQLDPSLAKITFLSAGTDGTDGPTDAAGAIIDNATLARAAELNLDAAKYLIENDSYHFFEQTGSLLKTGATQTNVMDMVVVLIEN